jgi:hypothetical protein
VSTHIFDVERAREIVWRAYLSIYDLIDFAKESDSAIPPPIGETVFTHLGHPERDELTSGLHESVASGIRAKASRLLADFFAAFAYAWSMVIPRKGTCSAIAKPLE